MKKGIPIAIIFLLVVFIVAGTIICINSFSNGKEENEVQLPIVNGTITKRQGIDVNLR